MYLTFASAVLFLLSSSDGRCPTPEQLDRTTDYIGLSKDPNEMAAWNRRTGKADLTSLTHAYEKEIRALANQTGNTAPKRFLCARAYQYSSHISHRACTGRTLDIPNEDVVEQIGFRRRYRTCELVGKFNPRVMCEYRYNNWFWGFWMNRIAALVVRPGCRLHVYNWKHFQHADHIYEEGTHHKLGWWDKKTSSWHCECDYSNEILHCNPREEFHRLNTCEDKNNEGGECEANISEGTEWGQEVTHGRSIDETLGFELGVALQEIFEAGLSYSQTVGESWETTKIKMNSQERGKSVTCNFAPNGNVTILEKVGICGDTTVHTGYYRCV